jgi:hypothetical protein
MSIKREHNGVLNHDHDSKNGVNGHDQMDGIQEPPFKKLKIAIETLPERKVESYGDDGGENYEEEKTYEDQFMELVRTIDFSKKSKKKKEKEENKNKNQNEWVWSKVNDSITRARGEMEQLVGLLDLLLKGEHVGLIGIMRPPQMPKVIMNEKVYELGSKQKQLKKSAFKLSQAAEELRISVQKENNYFDSVMQLRKEWKITAPPQNVNRYQPKFSVEFTYFNDGSLSRARELPLEINEETGDVELTLPRSLVTKQFAVASPSAYVEMSNFTSLDKVDELDDHSMSEDSVDDETIEKARGVHECHNLLVQAQRTLWFNELFKQISRDAQKCKKSLLQIFENEIKLETTEHEESFNIVFDSPEHAQLPKDRIDMESNEMSLSKLQADTLYSLIYIKLQEFLRNKHVEKEKEDHRSKFIKDFVRTDEKKKDDTMLDQLLTLVKHYKLRNQINDRVHRMCDNLTPLRLHWTTDKKHEQEFISEFELKYLNDFSMKVLLDGTEIRIDEVTIFETAEELCNHVLQKLSDAFMNKICSEVCNWISKDLVKKKASRVVFPYSNTFITIDVLYSVQQCDILFNVFETSEGGAMISLDLSELPGATHLDKVMKFIVHTFVDSRI